MDLLLGDAAGAAVCIYYALSVGGGGVRSAPLDVHDEIYTAAALQQLQQQIDGSMDPYFSLISL